MNREEVIRECICQGETPFYLFDLDAFAERIRKIKECLGERISLCYEGKSISYFDSGFAGGAAGSMFSGRIFYLYGS